MTRTLVLLYGFVACLTFLIALLYAIGFVANFGVPKGIDDGPATSIAGALVVNLLLLGIFAVQHSVMARPGFKAWWTRIVPSAIERSTYVLISSLLLGLLYWQWQPIAVGVWSVESQAGIIVLNAVYVIGWALVLYGSLLIDHFDLFGLRQVFLHWRGQAYTHPDYKELGTLYKLVRHPMMLGFVIAFWTTPHMTLGHLLFAIAYILIALQLEERDRGFRRQIPRVSITSADADSFPENRVSYSLS